MQVFKRLQNVQPEKVTKLNQKPCILGKLFKGDKLFTTAHYAYGLVSLIRPPCQPTPILLSLQCYWLLPDSKQKYTKIKNLTSINQGIKTGNIDKIFEVAKQFPDVWRQAAQIEWIENWIQNKRQNWEKALQLLALYYGCQDIQNPLNSGK